ncbi:glycosyltransferase [Shouchella lonarensis]|uniref:Glycosyl transferases group 1 n=1 Tax=Shouchella lonarensis TaxID=1464122 RepID=A0A1G6L7R2_9BACI|nr:glycosyltransferase [Shouchella lonarensis]SDC39231.1 Glycosyl transferases group 1 [Shouchella lonarensis]
MKNINLLFITSNPNYYLSRTVDYFIQALRAHLNIQVSYRSGFIQDIIDSSAFDPDFVYIDDYLGRRGPAVTGLTTLKCPYAVNMHDLHETRDSLLSIKQKKEILRKEGVEHIFVYCRDAFLRWYPEFSNYMRWLPHHANTNIYRNYELEKDIDFMMPGVAIQPYYPLRATIVERLKDRPEFVLLPHPHYRERKYDKEGIFIGEAYARELNRAKICFTCDTLYQYPVKKYFETPACHTLLLASFSQELYDLGFRPDENFVAIDENNFEEKAYDYLRDEEKRKYVTGKGMDMVHKRHATSKRAEEFVEMITKIINE